MVTDQASLSTLTGHVEAYEPDIDRVLITGEEIQAKLAELGSRSATTMRVASCSWWAC